MRDNQQGFSLIELIIVIVVLGILTATALPRFVGISGDARTAKLNAVLASVKSAAMLAKSAALVRQQPPNAPVEMSGVQVAMTNYHPSATEDGMAVAAGINADEGYQFSTDGSVATISVTGGSDPATCSFTYAPPATPNGNPVYGPLQTAGC